MKLPPILDLGAAAPLATEFNAARGQPVEVDAAAVERVGGLCLQVLVAAQLAWRIDAVPFAIVNPSEAFLNNVRLMAAHELVPEEMAA